MIAVVPIVRGNVNVSYQKGWILTRGRLPRLIGVVRLRFLIRGGGSTPAAVVMTCRDYTAVDPRPEAKRADDADAARRMLALALVSRGLRSAGGWGVLGGPIWGIHP